MLAVAALTISGCSTPAANAQAGNALPIATDDPPRSSGLSTTSSGVPVGAAPGDADRSVISAGEGRASAAPDMLTISLGVETKASSAQKALQDNNAAAAKVIALLKAQGIADDDLQTADVRVTALSDDRNSSAITGYQVSNSLTVTLRTLDSAGSTLDAVAASAGDAVRISDLRFGISDQTALLARARTAAVQQAQTRAAEMATAAGVTLGQVRTISDTQRVTPNANRVSAAPDAAGSAVPLEAGSLTVSVQVEVVYTFSG